MRSLFPRKRALATLLLLGTTVIGQTSQRPAAKDLLVDGKSLPGISSIIGDVGPSYAGQLSITDDPANSDRMFFWLWPPSEGGPDKDLTVWFGGGPGCSGLGAMLSEIGPFLLPKNNQNKTIVKRNPHSWTNAGWVMFIDQPGHVGLSEVEYLPDANQTVLAKQFAGFLSNFYHAFPDLKSKNLWLQGESYGGQFVPHFADYFYNLTGEDAVPLKGVGVVSGLFQSPTWAVNVPSYEYLKTHKDVLQLNASAVDAIDARAKELGLTGYFNQSLLYPPNGSILPPKNYTDDRERSVPYLALPYLLDTNPCFDFYDIRARCPAGFNPLASKNNFINATPGLRKALHVDEDNTWEACVKYKYIYPGGDPTPFAFEDGSFTRVVEKSQRVVIFGGQDDYKVLSLGTQLGLQNVTWNGRQGFQEEPHQQLVVDGKPVGIHHTERNLTFAVLDAAGHFTPIGQPAASLKLQKFLLGQIDESALGA